MTTIQVPAPGKVDVETIVKELVRPAQNRQGVTASEIVEATGRDRKWVHTQMRRLVRSGRVRVSPVVIVDITGRLNRSWEYILIDQNEG